MDDLIPKAKTHIGLIFQTDGVAAAESLLRYVVAYVQRTANVLLVHKDVSADKFWLKRGREP